MKIKRKNQAVSEVIGVILLLGISIALFAGVQLVVYSYPFEPSPPSLNLVASIDQENILIEHQGGERISLDALIRIKVGDLDHISVIARDYLNHNSSDDDEYWEIGEVIVYNPNLELTGLRVETSVIDKETNSVVMTGIVQRRSS
jgi:FlaG/FlaF family flagellin (archaellin)